jgi:hypothetical protein
MLFELNVGGVISTRVCVSFSGEPSLRGSRVERVETVKNAMEKF